MTDTLQELRDGELLDRARTDAPVSVEPFVGLLDSELLDAAATALRAIEAIKLARVELEKLERYDTTGYALDYLEDAQRCAEDTARSANEARDKGWSREALREDAA